MADIIRSLADTPLPTLLAIIGFLTLSVGFGLRVRVVFDVDRINKAYAKTIGAVLLLIGLVPYGSNLVRDVSPQLPDTGDPFLIYYLVSVPIIVCLYWATLHFTEGQTQLRAAKGVFMLVGSLVTLVVVWRAMDVFFYISSPDKHSVPLALYERHNYLPYLAILGTGVVASVLAIYAKTQTAENTGNRVPILSYFVVSCIYFAVFRLMWEFVDYIARAQVPPPH